MQWLRDAATGAGLTDVSTYVQSGNLLCTSRLGAAAVGKKIGDLMRAELSVDVEVMVRSRDDLATAVAANPFPEHVDEVTRLHLGLLSAAPAKAKVAGLDPEEFAPERYAINGREIYLWYPPGLARSKLAVVAWQRRLGVAVTGRNWRTVTTLLEMLGG
jgi:uncharacterized protein (DUF1697 family)